MLHLTDIRSIYQVMYMCRVGHHYKIHENDFLKRDYNVFKLKENALNGILLFIHEVIIMF